VDGYRHGWGGSRPAPVVRLPLAVAVVQVLGTAGAAHGQPGARPLDLTGLLLLLAGPALLLARRRQPLAVLVAVTAVTTGYALAGYPFGPFFLALVPAVFTAVAAGHRVATWLVVAAGYLLWVAGPALLPGAWPHQPSAVRAVGAALVLAWLVGAAEAGLARGRYRAELSRARAERERADAELERRRADEERLRIARELHDTLGHHLSLISVQAGVGLHLLDSRPEQARAALAAIRQASAEALREVRGVLAALDPGGDPAPRTPAPGLADLPDLLEHAGVPVLREESGQPRPLPPEVGRATYRIVREALTNVRRHAGPGARVTVRLEWRPDALAVSVLDDGSAGNGVGGGTGGRDGSGAGVGTGLTGMRERAAALGGTLRAGPRPAGGFEVAAVLPTGEES
jgi:signal transduction histidine kinase